MTLKLSYFSKNFTSWYDEKVKFLRDFIKTAFFWENVTSLYRGQFKYSNDFIKSGIFLRTFQEWFKFWSDIIKTALFLRKFLPVILGAGQIFKSHQQTTLIFATILPPDNRGISKFGVTSTKYYSSTKKWDTFDDMSLTENSSKVWFVLTKDLVSL